jgi:hypothetical protein
VRHDMSGLCRFVERHITIYPGLLTPRETKSSLAAIIRGGGVVQRREIRSPVGFTAQGGTCSHGRSTMFNFGLRACKSGECQSNIKEIAA